MSDRGQGDGLRGYRRWVPGPQAGYRRRFPGMVLPDRLGVLDGCLERNRGGVR